MSSTIKLYEHNQKAYDALLDMLGERDRACVIKPTGTGKFVIIAKMVQDNPDKRFLLLGTNDYMFNDQMANMTRWQMPHVFLSMRIPFRRGLRKVVLGRQLGRAELAEDTIGASWIEKHHRQRREVDTGLFAVERQE